MKAAPFTTRAGALRDFPFEAPFPSLLSLLGDRGPKERERVRPRLPVPFPF